MSVAQVAIRVDADQTIGSGHLSRCITLALALRDLGGVRVEMLMAESSAPTARDWLARHDLTAHWLSTASLRDAGVCLDRMAPGVPSGIVVDGYQFSPSYLARLRNRGAVTLFIDDVGEPTLDCDLVLNPNFHAEALLGVERRDLLAGPRFALVRTEFREARAKKHLRETVEKVLVTMGGADPDNVTCRVLRALDLSTARHLEVEVVVGPANPHASLVQATAAGSLRHDIVVLHDVAKMSEHMLRTDLAITATGVTCSELACVGVPTIGIAIAPNQVPVAAAGDALGVLASVGRSDAISDADIANALDALRTDATRRAAMVDRQRALIDGLGSKRVAAELLRRMTDRGGDA